MKNLTTTLRSVYLCFFILILNSCSKDLKIVPFENNLNRSEITNKILSDSNFYQLVYVYLTESQKIMNDTNDVDVIQNGNVAMQHALTNFFLHNPAFITSNDEDRKFIMKSISDSFKVKSPYIKHPNGQIQALVEKINLKNISQDRYRPYSNVSSSVIVQQINAEDIIGCAINAIASGIAGYGELFKDIRSIIRSGVSMGLAIDLTLDLVRNASPWWKVSSVVITFAACLYF